MTELSPSSPLSTWGTWDRVQAILGGRVYRSTELTYAGDLIGCGHCGHPITGESKVKKTKAGEREYVYYRCSRYNVADHPRVRLKEGDLDEQVHALFDRMRIEDEEVRSWFVHVLRTRPQDEQREARERVDDLNRQRTVVMQQQDRLLNLRLLEEIGADTFAGKSTELRDREAKLRLQIEGLTRGRHENADLAVKAFEQIMLRSGGFWK
ncbi:MAG: zinc ribbon domain-containing protein [Gemmataceae bacterium]|nr:zinc ribbon domain-containing protein [Gemmataceae bacterium]